MKNRIRSSARDRGQARGSVQSEGSGKSSLSLMSRKIKLFSDDRKPKNSGDTRYSPLVNQNPTTTEDSCAEDETALVQERSISQLAINHGFIREVNVLKTDSLQNPNELIAGTDKRIGGVKNTESEAKKVAKRGSPGNTGNVSIHQALVHIDIVGSQPQISVDPKDNNRTQKIYGQVRNDVLEDGHLTNNTDPTGQDLGTKQQIRSSNSARKEKAQYLGKRPGFTESDITSQSEDERPRSRLASLRRSHLSHIDQSEEGEATSRKDRDNFQLSATPEYPVQASNYVTTKRGTPIPSSVPMYTPKFVTVRGERNNAPDTSNYPPNSWDSKNTSNYPPNSWDSKNTSNYPPNSWDPTNQDFGRNKPLDLSAGSS